MRLSRRQVLAAGVAATGLRHGITVRLAVAPDAGDALTAGVRFGVEEASRAAALLGSGVELAANAPHTIASAGGLQINGAPFSLKAPDASYLEARRAAGFPHSIEDVAAVEWHHSLARYGASELNERFLRRTGVRMTSAHWLGWMAVKVIAEAALRARANEPLEQAVHRMRFDGHKGVALRFDEARRLPQPLYVVNLTKDTLLWQG